MLDDEATVARWDQRGGGRSLERMVLLGHSWGAQLALAYALARPERVEVLVYVSGTGIGPDADWHPAYQENARARLGEHPERLARWRELNSLRTRTEGEERERAVLQWSTEFEDRARAPEHAGRMADPWFPVNAAGNQALNAERKRTWGTPELHAACRRLDVPVLIVDGARDVRPRSAVDSPAEALPRVRRVVLPEAGHLPWVEDPKGFRSAVTASLGQGAVSDSRKSE